MTDRELLELAAKAGKMGSIISASNLGLMVWSDGCRSGFLWNSLTSNDDAFQLEVSLNMKVYFSDDDGVPTVAVGYPDIYGRIVYAIESHSGDMQEKLAATRRAITRAAAEIQLARERA